MCSWPTIAQQRRPDWNYCMICLCTLVRYMTLAAKRQRQPPDLVLSITKIADRKNPVEKTIRVIRRFGQGEPSGTRTRDPLIKSQMLYRPELTAHEQGAYANCRRVRKGAGVALRIDYQRQYWRVSLG